MKNDETMMMIALLLGGALLYSRKTAAATPPRTTNTGSMPGNVGTGNNQNLGGLIGSALAAFSGSRYGNQANGSPTAKTVMDNINFFKANPVNDIVAPIDYQTEYANNAELLNNVTQYGI